MSGYTIAWALWVIAFVVIEARAINNDIKDDTLSDHFAMWFKVNTKFGRTAWLVFSGVFFAWFVVHIYEFLS